MLCAMRATYIVLASTLGVLGATGHLTPALVLVIAAVAGLVRPNDLVMRNALIGETIPREHLMERSRCRARPWTPRGSRARSPAPVSRPRSASAGLISSS